MRIPVLEMRRGQDLLLVSDSPEALNLPNDWFTLPVGVRVHVAPVTGGWRLGLEIRTQVDRTCDRCLAEIRLPLAVEDNCLVLEAGAMEGAGEEDGLLVIKPDQDWVELDQVVRDAVFLSQSNYFTCREDCPGLCPQCGRNLNDGECGCRPPTPDSPLQALGGLRGIT